MTTVTQTMLKSFVERGLQKLKLDAMIRLISFLIGACVLESLSDAAFNTTNLYTDHGEISSSPLEGLRASRPEEQA